MFKLWIIYYWLGLLFKGKFSTREGLLKYQKKRLKRFQQKVLSQSAYYQKLIQKGYTVDDFPIIGKSEFVTHFDQINTVGLEATEAFEFAIRAEKEKDFHSELEGITVGLSTGTSGNRSLFLASSKEKALWAANVFFRVVKIRPFKKQKVAFILRANSNLYESVSSMFFQFKFFHLATPIEEIIDGLNTYKPDIISAQPSLMILLALAKKENRLIVSPTQLISYAEVLDELDRNHIESAFGKIITEVYQCTEGFLGHSCEYGTMHLHEDLVRIEKHYVEENRFQPIVTDFSRSSQPVVRYLMNDILIESEKPCPCGSTMMAIDKIEGRSDEVLLFEDETGKEVRIYPDFIRRHIVMASSDIQDYQIIQDSKHTISVFLACPSGQFNEIKKKLEEALTQLFHSSGVQQVGMHFSDKVPPKNSTDKMRRIMRKILVEEYT